MERSGFPDGPCVHAVIEECHQSAAPVPPDGNRMVPTARWRHLVRREIERINLGLGQIMPACHIALHTRHRKSRHGIDKFLFPSPRKYGTQVFACLVRRSTGICPFLGDGSFVNPVKELPDALALQFLDWGACTPSLPLSKR